MADEQLVAIVSTEGAIKRAVRQIRESLSRADEGSEFYFTIEASGRIQEGEVKLEFGLAESSYGTKVKGFSIQPVVDEYLRRHGWEKVNAPKAISFDKVAS
jgi:hypothetical protein